MNLKTWCVLVLLALSPGFSTGADAMTVHDFGKMNDDDEATFVTLLVEGAAQYFKAEGRPDQAHQVIAFFKTPGRDGGTYQFADEIKEAYAFNLRNATNPNNRIPERLVEDAMAATLKSHDLPVPAKYLISIGQGFRADGPPRAQAPSSQGPL